MILVDSSVWIGYFNGKKTSQTDWFDSILGDTPVVMGDLIMTEVLQGFQNDKDFRVARDILSGMPFMTMGGKVIALESAIIIKNLLHIFYNKKYKVFKGWLLLKLPKSIS